CTSAAAKTLRVSLHSDLKIVDPVWTTALITVNHGYMIYDTLFALDEKLTVKPQMVDRYETSADKLTWTFTLRDGLEWHDGTPVTAEDCVASLKRWAARDSLGQQLMASIGDMKAIDAKTFTIVLKEPFGLVLEALGKPSSNVKARQAAMYAIAQEDFLRAQVGDPEIYRVCNAPLVCGSPYEKSYGNLLIKPDFDKARQLLKESGYDGTPILMMQATDLQSS